MWGLQHSVGSYFLTLAACWCFIETVQSKQNVFIIQAKPLFVWLYFFSTVCSAVFESQRSTTALILSFSPPPIFFLSMETTCAFTHRYSYQPAGSSPPPAWKCCRPTGKRKWSVGNCAASTSTTEQRIRALQWPFLLGKIHRSANCLWPLIFPTRVRKKERIKKKKKHISQMAKTEVLHSPWHLQKDDKFYFPLRFP